jgi:hypothetical protein
MDELPAYIPAVFLLGALFTILLFYKATSYSRPALIVLLFWLALQTALSLSGFYNMTNVRPPRFAFLLLPPVVFIIALFFTGKGRRLIDKWDVKLLTLIHLVRIPVELTLYWLFLHSVVPRVMTFEGRNFDILAGLTAPFVYYFGYVRNVLGRKALIVWNVVCLLLLANIVVTAVLSAPFSFQRFGLDRPNFALVYFPYTWLPCFLVPVVFLSHLAAIRGLLR